MQLEHNEVLFLHLPHALTKDELTEELSQKPIYIFSISLTKLEADGNQLIYVLNLSYS